MRLNSVNLRLRCQHTSVCYRIQHGCALLVEAVWHYGRAPRLETTLERRQEAQPAAVIAIAWKAQQRLHRTRRRLDTERRKGRTIVAVAVAHQLAGFVWAIATAD